MYPSQTKKSKCGYCFKEMLDDNLREHCKNVHKKPKSVYVKGQRTFDFTPVSEPGRKQSRSDEGETSAGISHAEHQTEAVTLDDVTDNNGGRDTGPDSTVCDNVIPGAQNDFSTSSSLAENSRKLDMVLTELSKLNLRIPNVSAIPSAPPRDSVQPARTLSEDQIEQLPHCKTVNDICAHIACLTYEPDEQCLVCTACVIYPSQGGAHTPGRFAYCLESEELFQSNNLLSRDFRNLKTHVKRHLENEVHLRNTNALLEKENIASNRETRAHAVGMRIGRLCYAGYKIGSSKRNFENEILKCVLNGLDVGDINHSKEFYSNFMPFVSKEIEQRLTDYFGQRLEQTGFLPPVNVQADKGTSVHRTRQFTSIITVVPGSPELLTNIYLGQPVVKSHDGPGVTTSITAELSKWNISSVQIEGGSFDGQYFHLSVPQHLADSLHLPEQFFCSWDPLHKGGLVDKHIREDASFKWLVDLKTICREIYTTFNWGKNYENFLQVCADLDIEKKQLTNFSMTRFANSVRFVFINLRADYSAVRQSLQNLITDKESSSDAKDRSKAVECKSVFRKIDSRVFTLSLSGCADIYNLFGILSNECQKVNLLPHERFDKVKTVIAKFLKMMKTIDHSDCPDKSCLWPRYHADLTAMDADTRYMGSVVKHINIGTERQTRLQSVGEQLTVADGLGMVKERLKTFCWRLHHDLSNEVYDANTTEIIENCRLICDIKSLLLKLSRKGSVLVGLEGARPFVDAVRKITGSVSSVKDEDLIQQYRKFLDCIENIFIKTRYFQDLSKTDSKEIIQAILKRPTDFNTTRVIVHCICVASVKVSVESVVESLVSRFEHHFGSSRQPSEEHSLDEMIIVENGPLLHHADTIIENAMTNYWKEHDENGDWHFIRRTEDVRSYTGGTSKVVGKLLDQSPKLPFM